MSLSCLLITTNSKQRSQYLDNTIASIEKQNTAFDQKLLSVDILSGEDTIDISYFRKYGWDVTYAPAMGMIYNQARGLSKITSDHVVYCEDKVIINHIPIVTSALDKFDFICYNMHIIENFCSPSDDILKYINDKRNYMNIDNELFLIKNNMFKDDYYLNFPVAITHTKLLRELHKYGLDNYPNRAGEIGITKAWFELKKSGKVGIYVRSDIEKHMPINLMDFFHMAHMKYWNNDPSLRMNSIKEAQGRQDPEPLQRRKILEEYEKKWINKEGV